MKVAIRVQNEARRLCPVDTGTLRRSIAYSIQGSGDRASARVGSNLDYALAVEEGTGIYGIHHSPIVPKTAKFLRFKGRSGAFIFVRSVKGSPGRHFLRDALRAVVHGR